MNKILKLVCCAVIATISFSCSKEPVQNASVNDIPDGYTKVYFNAGVETKTVIGQSANNQTEVYWTENESINIWYKNAEGKAEKVAAEVESCSGREAVFSALIPKDANMDEFYAEKNGVHDKYNYLPFGSYSSESKTCSRVKVEAEQNAVLNSFDPEVAAIGARWVKSENLPNPTFSFKHLTNLLKINVNNETGKSLNKIVFKNDTPVANTNYWYIEDNGNLSVKGGSNGSAEITLNGSDLQDGDYYFVISIKSNSSSPLQNMEITFYFEDGYYRTFTNPKELSTNGYYLNAYLGSFTLKTEELQQDIVIDDSTYAPFGTSWGISAIKKGVQGEDGKYTLTSTDANAYVTYEGHSDAYTYIKGKYITFEFYNKSMGNGLLTFTYKVKDAAKDKVLVIVNDDKENPIKTYNSTTKQTVSVEIPNVSLGDKITIRFEGPSSSNDNRLYFESVTWAEKASN